MVPLVVPVDTSNEEVRRPSTVPADMNRRPSRAVAPPNTDEGIHRPSRVIVPGSSEKRGSMVVANLTEEENGRRKSVVERLQQLEQMEKLLKVRR